MENSDNQKTKLNTTPALELIWGQFKMWDITASQNMTSIRTWRQRVLYLTISGAFFGVLSGIVSAYLPEDFVKIASNANLVKIISTVLAVISTICISLGTYAGGQVLSEEKEKAAIKSRALAEAYKSEAFQYIFKAGQYKKDQDNNAFAAVQKLITEFSGLEALSIKKEDELTEIPEMDYNIDTYIKTRVEDQIYGYYNKKVSQYQAQIKKYNKIIFTLGFLGVIFGSFGAAGYAKYTSVWIAFIASATAALGSFVASNRFQQTIITFQASSNRLKTILSRWKNHPTKDQDAIAEFVEDIEEELMRENKAWVAESSKKLKQEEDLLTVAQNIEKEGYESLKPEAKQAEPSTNAKHKTKEKHPAKHKEENDATTESEDNETKIEG